MTKTWNVSHKHARRSVSAPRTYWPEHGRGYEVMFHGNSCGRGNPVGGSFLEKFIFPLRIKCPGTTLSIAFNEEMTPEQYFHS